MAGFGAAVDSDTSAEVAWQKFGNVYVLVRHRYFSRHKNNQQREINMRSQTVGLRVAGTIFALVCVGHLLRVVTRADVIIAGHQVPLWPTLVGVVIAGALSAWMWKLSSIARR